MMLETDDPRVNLSNGQFAARGDIGDNDGTVISTITGQLYCVSHK